MAKFQRFSLSWCNKPAGRMCIAKLHLTVCTDLAYLLPIIDITNIMKRLLLIISFLPCLGFAQTSDQMLYSGNQKAPRKDYAGAIAEVTRAIQLNDKNTKAFLYRG